MTITRRYKDIESNDDEDHEHPFTECVCGKGKDECEQGHLLSYEHQQGVRAKFQDNVLFESIIQHSLLYGNHVGMKYLSPFIRRITID